MFFLIYLFCFSNIKKITIERFSDFSDIIREFPTTLKKNQNLLRQIFKFWPAGKLFLVLWDPIKNFDTNYLGVLTFFRHKKQVDRQTRHIYMYCYREAEVLVEEVVVDCFRLELGMVFRCNIQLDRFSNKISIF